MTPNLPPLYGKRPAVSSSCSLVVMMSPLHGEGKSIHMQKMIKCSPKLGRGFNSLQLYVGGFFFFVSEEKLRRVTYSAITSLLREVYSFLTLRA